MEQKVVKLEVGKVLAVLLGVVVVAVLAAVILQGGAFKGTIDPDARITEKTLVSEDSVLLKEAAVVDSKELADVSLLEPTSIITADKTEAIAIDDTISLDKIVVAEDSAILATTADKIEAIAIDDTISLDKIVVAEDPALLVIEPLTVVYDDGSILAIDRWGGDIVVDEVAKVRITGAANALLDAGQRAQNDAMIARSDAVMNAGQNLASLLSEKKQYADAANTVMAMFNAYQSNVFKLGQKHSEAIAAIMALNASDLGLPASYAPDIELMKIEILAAEVNAETTFAKAFNAGIAAFAKNMAIVKGDYPAYAAQIDAMAANTGRMVQGFLSSDNYSDAFSVNIELMVNPSMRNYWGQFGDFAVNTKDEVIALTRM